ncbi:MAG: PilZ domain-containing protein [Magnetococcales bacterium]|nr:PilZ domain-containing protein [Magnetococcales bacterium]
MSRLENMEDIFRGKKKVFASLLRAQQQSVLLEITFTGGASRERYGSRVLSFPGYEGGVTFETDILAQMARQLREAVNDDEGRAGDAVVPDDQGVPDAFLIVPLEPTTGNMKIRKVPQVVVRFFIGLELYEIVTTFQKVVMVSGTQAIQLALPGLIRIHPRRQQERVTIPPQANMSVVVQKRGSAGFKANLLDLSPGGLSFASTDAHEPLVLGDKVGVTIQGPILQGTPLSTFASVCRIARVRDGQNLQQASQLYGVQFKLVSVADAMTIDRLVRDLSKKPR